MEIWEFFEAEGSLIQGIAINVAGHDLQIVRFDYDNSQFLVKMDERIRMMSSDEVEEYILRRL